jgi:hypothetical protein
MAGVAARRSIEQIEKTPAICPSLFSSVGNLKNRSIATKEEAKERYSWRMCGFPTVIGMGPDF